MGNVAHLADKLKFRGASVSTDSGARSWANFNGLKELKVAVDEPEGIAWLRVCPIGRPSVTSGLLAELQQTFSTIKDGYSRDLEDGRSAIKYLVMTSDKPGIFSLGGDLPLFIQCITSGNKAALRKYAYSSIDIVYGLVSALDLPIHTIGLMQGDALGGGFECALATDVIIAEKSAKFGLPEVLFRLFPGMGAYTFLTRKMDMIRAEQMILSGKIYSADELHAMGLVDIVCGDGEGEAALYDYVEKYERTYTTRQSIMRARKIAKPVSREELIAIVDVWVDAALSLGPSDLRKMHVIAKAQDRRWDAMNGVTARTPIDGYDDIMDASQLSA